MKPDDEQITRAQNNVFLLILGPTMAVTQDQIQELLANHEAEKEPVQRTRSSMPDPGRKFSRKFSKYIPR